MGSKTIGSSIQSFFFLRSVFKTDHYFQFKLCSTVAIMLVVMLPHSCEALLRWLPTVLTVCTPEEGWRTKNELFVSTFGFKLVAFTVKISHTPGISFSLTWVCCKMLPWQQTSLKITIFWLFSTYLLPFLELASVKYLETRQSCENDFG